MEISDLKVTCAICGKKHILYSKKMKIGTNGKVYCVECEDKKMEKTEKNRGD